MKTPEIAVNMIGLNASAVAVKAQSIHDSLTNTTNFSSISSYLPNLQTAITNLTNTITAGGNTPTPAQTANIRAAVKSVIKLMKLIAALVNYEALGDEAKLLSSGFELKSAVTANNLKTFIAKQGSASGSVDIEAPYFLNAAYVWQMSPDPISNWQQIAITTIGKTTQTNLLPGNKYWFRVLVTKGTKQVYISDPYMVHVI